MKILTQAASPLPLLCKEGPGEVEAMHRLVPSAGLSAAEFREPLDRFPVNDPVVGVFLR